MYGIVEVSGHQYKVQPGDIIDVEKLDAEEGASLDLDRVLFIGGDRPLIGKPIVAGAKIAAKVIRQDRSRKILVGKRKQGLWKKKRGHRQHYTALLITELSDGNGNNTKIDPNSKNAEKFLK